MGCGGNQTESPMITYLSLHAGLTAVRGFVGKECLTSISRWLNECGCVKITSNQCNARWTNCQCIYNLAGYNVVTSLFGKKNELRICSSTQ
jgi:hypothetical protein